MEGMITIVNNLDPGEKSGLFSTKYFHDINNSSVLLPIAGLQMCGKEQKTGRL